jgi:diaminohydroxyphosphoribosylaminopyrimidine deaminase/5-amino-6-(5-phosphoribosylamino)uracil reductase
MRRALALAARGLGLASPNPMVGAVLVRDGRIVGEGWHLYARRDHAEVVALQQAGERARGAELFVTLEPCCHHGRTPPCVDRIVAAGVRRVVAATVDPNPQVCGRGLETLRQAGVAVECGLLDAQARRLNQPFFHFMRTGRPLVTLKLALSLDGRIALASGVSKWITGEAARRAVQRLRRAADAVAVGINTVLADDPRLDVRIRSGKSITKAVVDSRLRCPPGARLFDGNPVLLFHGPQAPAANRRHLSPLATLLEVPEGPGGLSWPAVVAELGRRRVLSLLLEGGGKAAAGALQAGIVDRLAFFYSPRLLGGDAIPAVGELGLTELERSPRFVLRRVRRVGADLLVEAEREDLEPA